ncbi:MAG: EAL domain-containing protein [Rhodocyclaceae bacterium]
MNLPSVDALDSLSHRLQTAFIGLSKDAALWEGDLNTALRDVAVFVCETMRASRAGIWLVRRDAGVLDGDIHYTHEVRAFDEPRRVELAALPHYLQVLDASRVIEASDALNDPRTTELAASYLGPCGIGAVLHAALHTAGRLCGVVCIEHVGSARLWSREERAFAGSVADLVSQLLVFHELKDSERRYRMLFESAGDAIFTLRGSRFVDCNQRAAELFGCSRDVLLTLRPDDLSPSAQPDGQPSIEKAAAMIRRAQDGAPQFFEWVHRRQDGTLFDAEVSLTAIALGHERYTLAIVRDITDRQLAERARAQAALQLEQRNNALQVVNSLASRLQGLTDITLIAEETVRVLHLLRRADIVSFFRLDSAEGRLHRLACMGQGSETLNESEPSIPLEGSLGGLALREQHILISPDIASDPRMTAQGKLAMIQNGVRSLVSMPLIYRNEAFGTISLLFQGSVAALAHTELDTLNAVCQTVALAMANARHVQDLEYQAMHDSLTGLPNRTHLHRQTSAAIERAQREGTGVTLMLLDLNRFKEVNDTLGHHSGDHLLKLVAARLATTLAPFGAMLARLGGDEFAVLLPGDGRQEEAQAFAGLLSVVLRQPFDVQGIALELGASVGVALYPEHGETSHALLRCADVAMYVAKTKVGGVSVFDPQYDTHNPRRLAMITELGSAINSDQLVLHYQPKLDLATNTWSGCEALVRWEHPTLGRIAPAEFIPYAETSDLIRPLTLWVAREALRQLRRWRDAGLDVSVAINLSTRNLLDVTLPDALADLLAEMGVPPAALELEITETSLISDPDRALAVVDRLVAQGMRLSIDDFGTGYSSLAYLRRLPLASLKIDRSFVQDMLADEQDAIIVRSTIALAHSLGLRVVAEGVESAAILEALRTCGCDEVQGYLLGHPMAAHQVAALFAARTFEV